MADVGEAVARNHLLDAAVERIAGHVDQFLDLGRHRSQRQRDRRVAMIALAGDAEVEADDVAVAQLPRTRDAVHDFVVHRNAEHARVRRQPVRPVAEEGRLDAALADRLAGVHVEFARGDARLRELAQFEQHLGDVTRGLPHRVDLTARLHANRFAEGHHDAIAPSMRAATSSIEPASFNNASTPRLR